MSRELVDKLAKRAVEDFIRDNDEVHELAYSVAEEVMGRIQEVCRTEVNALNIPQEIRTVAHRVCSEMVPTVARHHLTSYENVILAKVGHFISTCLEPEFKRQSSKRREIRREITDLQQFITKNNKGIADFNDEVIRQLRDLTVRVAQLEIPWYRRLFQRNNSNA